MSTRRIHRLARRIRGRFILSTVLPLAAIAAPAALRAQSNLSTQGFGYPPGQLSSRALATGGSIGEIDPLSPINPAAISVFGTRVLFFQIEPEYRTVTTGAGSERTTTARYPNVFGALPVGSNFVVSFGSSTLLDRTATTSFGSTQFLTNGDSVPMSTTYRIDGAMDDLRLAAGWAPTGWLRLGLGAHAITGHNLISLSQSFTDSTQFSAFTQSRVLGFGGTAVSGGVELVSRLFNFAASGRLGGPLSLNAEDTVISRARVPNRFGASLSFTGLPNSAFSVRTSRDNWSSLGNLGTPGLVGVDAWDSSVGADVAGPKFGQRIVFVRAGFRDRTLPFAAAGQKVTEKSFSGGLGTTFASGHVLTDLAIVRALRDAGSVPATERAWTISLGITVQP